MKGYARTPMSKPHKYRCLIRWQHRKFGPQWEKGSAEGTSIRRAAHHYLLGFFSDTSNREKRRDAHAHLQLEIWREKPHTAQPRHRHG
jgi:hypothetical protein